MKVIKIRSELQAFTLTSKRNLKALLHLVSIQGVCGEGLDFDMKCSEKEANYQIQQ